MFKFLLLTLFLVIYADDNEQLKENKPDYGTVIGIDLGTTYSCVGVYKGQGSVQIIANDQGNRITPSFVAFSNLTNSRLIGDAAKNQLTINPKNTIFDIKRLIGRSWHDESVQKDLKNLPFKVVKKGDKPVIEVEFKGEVKQFTAEEISSMILGKMKKVAEEYLGYNVTHAVVTVPAYFNNAQREATKDAGAIVGLNIIRVLNEPTAAAIAYGLNQKSDEKNVLVFDLGGGTFDVSLLTVDSDVFEVIATAGDTHLGGEDFDQNIVDYFVKLYKKKTGNDVRKSVRSIQKLKREAEKAKRTLSKEFSVKIEVESFYKGNDFSETLTRAKFEDLNLDLFKSTIAPVEKVLNDADMSKDEIDEIVLVGGSTRIPKIQKLIQQFFNGKEPVKGINPDEAVAFGAAVQGGIMSGNYDDLESVLLIDVNPLSLGIETLGGVMTKIVERNTRVPAIKEKQVTTVNNDQTTITVSIFEGERGLVKDNHKLGEFDITGIPSAPKGEPKILITLELDTDGILKVTAKDKDSDAQNSIEIKNTSTSLSPEEIEKMILDGEKFAEEDKILVENIQSRTSLEQMAYQAKNEVSKDEIKEKLEENEIENVVEKCDEIINWLDENAEAETDVYKEKLKELKEIVDPVMSKCGNGEEIPLDIGDDNESGDIGQEDEEEFDETFDESKFMEEEYYEEL